jgi:hypothetical protein
MICMLTKSSPRRMTTSRSIPFGDYFFVLLVAWGSRHLVFWRKLLGLCGFNIVDKSPLNGFNEGCEILDLVGETCPS